MAKQLVGPVERHVEKAILGIAGILLVGVVARYLVTSPTQMELDGTVVGPSTIDAHVLAKARDLRKTTKQRQPTIEVQPPLLGEFEQYTKRIGDQLVSLDLPSNVPIGVTVPIIDPPEVILGDASLVEVVQLSQPSVTQGRSTLEAAGGLLPTNWVTVSAIFSRKDQQSRQATAYGATRQEVLFGQAEIQRRARRADGSWSDDDWEVVDASPAPTVVPVEPTLTLDTSGDEPVVEREQLSLLRRYTDKLREELVQRDLVHPLMHVVFNGDTWRFPIVTTFRDVLLQEDEILRPRQEGPSPELEDRYGFNTLEQEVAAAAELTPAQEIKAYFELGNKLMNQAMAGKVLDDAIGAYNAFEEVVQHPNATPGDKKKAERLGLQAERVISDIRRLLRRPGPVTPGQEEVERKLLPALQLWAHDAGGDSVESGHAYQYRIRAQVYNQLAGEPGKFSNKEDALVLMIAGPWSEPTEVVEILPTDYFYATAADKRKKNVSFDLYRWFEGYWVTNKSKVKCGVGDVIKQEQRVAVPNPDDPEEIEYPLTTFSPNAMVVGIDFNRWYRDRNTRGGGAKFSKPTTTSSVVLVNAKGELQERFVGADKSNPMRKLVGGRVFKPSRR